MQIHHVDQQKAAWFESVSDALYIFTLLKILHCNVGESYFKK